MQNNNSKDKSGLQGSTSNQGQGFQGSYSSSISNQGQGLHGSYSTTNQGMPEKFSSSNQGLGSTTSNQGLQGTYSSSISNQGQGLHGSTTSYQGQGLHGLTSSNQGLQGGYANVSTTSTFPSQGLQGSYSSSISNQGQGQGLGSTSYNQGLQGLGSTSSSQVLQGGNISATATAKFDKGSEGLTSNMPTTINQPYTITTIHTVKKKVPKQGNRVRSNLPSTRGNTSGGLESDNKKFTSSLYDDVRGDRMNENDKEDLQRNKEKYDFDPKERVREVYDMDPKDENESNSDDFDENESDQNENENENETGMIGHRLQEMALRANANLKEKIGVGVGDTPPKVDRLLAEEQFEEYTEKVKENNVQEVGDSRPIVHKIKEMAHNVNANFKELLGVGLGNYSSEVDRELSDIHKQKYEEKTSEFKNEEEITK